jgi:hypothetical protein
VAMHLIILRPCPGETVIWWSRGNNISPRKSFSFPFFFLIDFKQVFCFFIVESWEHLLNILSVFKKIEELENTCFQANNFYFQIASEFFLFS